MKENSHSQSTAVQYTPLNTKANTNTTTQVDQHNHTDVTSIDLTNKAQPDFIEPRRTELLSQTAKHEMLTANQLSGNNLDRKMISNLLESQASSPTMRSDLAMTAKAEPQHNRRAPAHQSSNSGQQEVLAASGRGQIYHLKSQSTGNSNYLSNAH